MDDVELELRVLRYHVEAQQKFLEGLWGLVLSYQPVGSALSIKESLLNYTGELDTATSTPTDVAVLEFEAEFRKTYGKMFLNKIDAIEQSIRDQRRDFETKHGVA